MGLAKLRSEASPVISLKYFYSMTPISILCRLPLRKNAVCESGTFNDLDHHQIAALASCFIPGDRSNEQIQLRSELARPLQQLQESARRIAEVLYCITSFLFICAIMNNY